MKRPAKLNYRPVITKYNDFVSKYADVYKSVQVANKCKTVVRRLW
jgi:hypothetical protein